jgi:hypothetical protein
MVGVIGELGSMPKDVQGVMNYLGKHKDTKKHVGDIKVAMEMC